MNKINSRKISSRMIRPRLASLLALRSWLLPALLLCSTTASAQERPNGERTPSMVELDVAAPLASSPLSSLPTITPVGPDDRRLQREINPRSNPLAGEPDAGRRGTWDRDEPPIDPLIGRASRGPGSTPGLDVSFEGDINNCGCTPPDTHGDVGPNHYVQIVNSAEVMVYGKSGTLLAGPISLGSLWPSGNCTSDTGDGIVVYDSLADRWLLSQFAFPTHMCFAVSQTTDPLGAYWLYEFNVGAFPDYFKLGAWPDAYYMSANEANPLDYTAYAFDRNSMLAGAVATGSKFSGISNLLLPSDLDGKDAPPLGAPNIFYTFKDGTFHGDSDRLELHEFHVDWITPANTTFTAVTPELSPAAFTYTPCGFFNFNCITQLGTAQTVDAVGEWPMTRFAYRNFGSHQSLVGSFTVGGGLAAPGAAVRWFELRKIGAGAWTLYQQGTVDPGDGHNRFMSSISMDRKGNIALGYSVASGTLSPSIRYTVREAGDALGTMRPEQTLIAGGGSQTGSNRWGDYSALSTDPANDCTFYYTNEYYSASTFTAWQTRVGAFTIPGCLEIFADGFESGTLGAW